MIGCLVAFLLLTIQNLHGHGDLEVRIAELSGRILTNSSNAQLFLERGELHRLHQDWPAATADFDRAASLDSKLAAVGVARARLLVDSGHPHEAREAYDVYLAQATNDGVALIERARVRVKLEELEGALTDYTRGIDLLPEPLPEYYVERAELLVHCGKPDQAVTGLDEGIRRLGIIVTLQTKAIELELSRTNLDAALRRLETIRVRANRQELWLEREGQILRQAGRGAEAQAAFEAALQAVAKLPARLQTTPQMENLKARVRLEIGEIAGTNAPPPANR
jgi:tetratricopeptide (TPR) repeat protein